VNRFFSSQNVVCISTIDWDFVWQGHQEIMSTLARQGHRVLFIENTGVRRATLKDLPRLRQRLMNWRLGVRGVRKVMDNLYVYAPLVLPFPYSRVARAVNKAIMFWMIKSWTKTMRFDNPIVWTWLPTALAMDLIRALEAQLVVYYCCDDFQASSSGSKRIRETENPLISQADLVFAHSKALFDRCQKLNGDVHVFQYGFNSEVFARASEAPPADLAMVPKPILGYIGGIHRHVDQALLECLATVHPDKSLVLVGPLQVPVPSLAKLPNVYCLGQKKYTELPSYIKHFDVGLIPYVLNEYTRSVYPTKLNEYLIMGKPVVSTRLPEVEYFNQCHRSIVAIANDRDSFVESVQRELTEDNDSLRRQRIIEVERNTWSRKIEAMQGLIQAKLDEKSKVREVNWQDNFRDFYRFARKRIIASAMASAMVYALLFHSPALWLAGKPLQIVGQPVQADVIAVLAGGIGESGEPSENYQEKVKHGVELYRQGYASKMIFSSGVYHTFNEARVMKALAVSLGVPETAIILDEIGGGNYASLLHVKTIMLAEGWTRMLLVTSRYNTGRSRLVVQKNMAGFIVTFTPAPQSVFFGDQRQIELRHIKAILHEYASILYYWIMAYI